MIPGKGIYNKLPVWGQMLAVNAVSARNWRDKYGAPFPAIHERLQRNERKSRDELLAGQKKQLQQLLRYALNHVPHYRTLNCSPDRLDDWPVLTKATVMGHPERFLSDEFAHTALLENRTSGTTGTPLTVRFTKNCHKTEMAFRWRHRAWGGVPFPSRGAYVSGHPVVPPNQTHPPFWRLDRVEKRLLCSSYHLAPQHLDAYLNALAAYAPDFLQGYPSSLYLLAKHALETGNTKAKPRAVFTTSETLLDFQRAAIEQAFGVKVFNWYGNSEMTANIVECPAGNLHYRVDYGMLELLDDGTMLCTGLNNFGMPFIRYRVGDRAFAKHGLCPCGCEFPLIEKVEGRIEDYIRAPDGRFVGRLDHLFKEVQHVREAQIVQQRLDEIILRIVRADGYNDADEQIIRHETNQRLGAGVTVRFEYVTSIERTPAGKFRFIVSQLPRDPIQSPGP